MGESVVYVHHCICTLYNIMYTYCFLAYTIMYSVYHVVHYLLTHAFFITQPVPWLASFPGLLRLQSVFLHGASDQKLERESPENEVIAWLGRGEGLRECCLQIHKQVTSVPNVLLWCILCTVSERYWKLLADRMRIGEFSCAHAHTHTA